MQRGIYGRLADLFDEISFGTTKGPELEHLLRALFDEEEALVALNLSPVSPEPPQTVAERMGGDPDRVSSLLDTMADKGLVYCSQRGGEKWYKVIQVIPGIFELQFMKGEDNDRTRRLARLFEAYFQAQERSARKEPITPFARVIPVERTVYGGIEVFPYEEAGRYVDEAETISVSTCYCRHKQRLLGRGCDYPDDVCLQFGSFARFVIQRGFGREISKEEAGRILERCREAGLVHTSNNTRDHIDFICNCCSCCCGILHSVRSSTMPSMAASSNYLARVDEQRCVACGICVERCQMGAIGLDGDAAEVDEGRCIGCGVCVEGCPSEALVLVRKERVTEPAKDFRELVMRQLEDKKRLGLLSSG